MKHLVVVNPKSFSKKTEMLFVVDDIKSFFDNDQADYLIHISRYPRDAISVVKEYVQSANELVRVYSVGGDGILFDCLNGIANLPNTELAIIPYGTSTDFVRAFGEDKYPLFRDIEKQANAGTIPTDIISVGHRYILGFCCIGFEASVIFKYRDWSRRFPILPKIFGKSFYFAGVPHTLFDKKLTTQKYEVRIDGKLYDGQYVALNFANTPCYGGDKVPFPAADPTDGYIDIMLINSKITPRFLAAINDYLKGKAQKYPDIFKGVRGKEISIISDSPIQIVTDGEPYFDSSVHAKILSGAVQIVTPDGTPYKKRI